MDGERETVSGLCVFPWVNVTPHLSHILPSCLLFPRLSIAMSVVVVQSIVPISRRLHIHGVLPMCTPSDIAVTDSALVSILVLGYS